MENIKTLDIKKTWVFGKFDVFNLILSFLLGRVVLFDCMSPFALGYLAANTVNNPNGVIKTILVAAAALAGAMSRGLGVALIKYILAIILFGLIFTAVSTVTEKHNIFATSGIAGASILTAGGIFIGQWGATPYYIAMLVTESIVCFCITACAARSLGAINNEAGEITSDSIVGLFALAALSVLGFSDLTVGAISIGKALAGVYIMIIACCCGVSGGSVGGLGIGILYSFAMHPAIESIGIFGICGMLSGYLSRFKRLGVVCGFILSGTLVLAYTGSSLGDVLSVFDILAAVLIFCLIPKSVLLFLENILITTLPADKGGKLMAKKLYDRITCLVQSVIDIADNASEMLNIKTTDNKNDIMMIYDKAADKVCKHCGLKFVCWDKEYASTCDQVMHLTPTLQQNGVIEAVNIPADFKGKCVKYKEFVSTVNTLYARYRLDNMWIKKVEASKKLVSQHLYGFAEMMEAFAEDTKNQLDFVPNPDNILYLALKKYGIKCYDCTVIKNNSSQYEIWVKTAIYESSMENVIADITSQTFGRRFYVKSTEEANKRLTFRLLERERYFVKTGCASRTKDDSTSCGDSYCQKKLEHNKHLAILSDGMGSGENARSQSLYAVNIMLRLLNCGFNKECAIKIMNLFLYLRQTEESFATIDAAVIDLFEGSVEFIKFGAAKSYVKRGSEVKTIASDSLPAGMMAEITPCTNKTKIKSGDMIVLTSDGVYGRDEGWICNYIKEFKEKNPQKLAENIIKEAIIRNDHTVTDDMTVITLLIDEELV